MGNLRVMQTFGTPRATTNPYIVQLSAALAEEPRIEHVPFDWRVALFGHVDVLHVHWADTLLAARNPLNRWGKRLAMTLLLCRIAVRGTAVVRTVHNIESRDVNRLDGALIRRLEERAVLRIHLTSTTPSRAGTLSVVIPHGHYVDWFADFAKEQMVDGRIGYVGLLKAYKGIDNLLTAYGDASTPGLSLRLAGRPADAETSALIADRLPDLSNAEADLRYISEAELVTLVTSSEVVVLPYRQMHNSGAALAALSLSRPIIVPANPTNAALAEEVGEGWVQQFAGDLDGNSLDAAITDLRSATRSADPDLSNRGWTDAGRLHADAYLRATAEQRKRRTHR
ncbi:glycosyltransferase family protein [Microbacterium sp. GXF0217]